MKLFNIIRIKSHERGLWFRYGEFQGVLAPGAYRVPFWDRGRDTIEIVNTLDTLLRHPMLDAMLARDETVSVGAASPLRDHLLIVDNTDTERALIWRDNRLAYVLGGGRWAFWTAPFRLHVERYDVRVPAPDAAHDTAGAASGAAGASRAFRFEHPRLQAVLAHPDAARYLDGVMVGSDETVLLYRDGVLLDTLSAGMYVYWKGTGKVAWKTVDRREQVADVAGQEIITADKVSLRVNLVVTWQVADPLRAVTASADHAQALYREAQLALRAAVGTRLLDHLLADKASVGAEVLEALVARAGELGLTVKSVGLRDIILPGDMKALLNQVMAAQKEAEANLIRRREETAQVRSQANTAKLLTDNPALARLKELELLKEVLAGTKATFLFGSGDIAEQVRGLVTEKDAT